MTNLYFITIFIISFLSCKDNSTPNKTSESKDGRDKVADSDCGLPLALSEVLNDYELGTNPTYFPNQQTVLQEIKENSEFSILTRAEVICYPGNSEDFLPSEEAILGCIKIVQKYHLLEIEELENLMKNAKLEHEYFHSDGRLSYRFRTLTNGNGDRFEEFLDIAQNGDTVKYQISGSGFGWHHCDKSMINDPRSRGMFFKDGTRITYERAGIAIEYDKNNPLSFSLGIGFNGGKTIYSSFNGKIELSTVDIYPDSNPLEIYLYEQSENRLYFENGEVVSTKYGNNRPRQRASYNYKTGKWMQYHILSDSVLIEMDYDLEMRGKEKSSDTQDYSLYVKNKNIDRRFYKSGKLMSEWDFISKTKTSYNEDGNIASKISQGYLEINEAFSSVWDVPNVKF